MKNYHPIRLLNSLLILIKMETVTNTPISVYKVLNKNDIDVVLYHGNCADGFGSAFITWLYFKNRSIQVTTEKINLDDIGTVIKSTFVFKTLKPKFEQIFGPKGPKGPKGFCGNQSSSKNTSYDGYLGEKDSKYKEFKSKYESIEPNTVHTEKQFYLFRVFIKKSLQ